MWQSIVVDVLVRLVRGLKPRSLCSPTKHLTDGPNRFTRDVLHSIVAVVVVRLV